MKYYSLPEADFQSVELNVNAQIETSQPDLLVIAHKEVTVLNTRFY